MLSKSGFTPTPGRLPGTCYLRVNKTTNEQQGLHGYLIPRIVLSQEEEDGDGNITKTKSPDSGIGRSTGRVTIRDDVANVCFPPEDDSEQFPSKDLCTEDNPLGVTVYQMAVLKNFPQPGGGGLSYENHYLQTQEQCYLIDDIRKTYPDVGALSDDADIF